MECPICFEISEDTVNCLQCNQGICLNCFTKIDNCPFCRKSYTTSSIDKINSSCERIDRMIERLARLIERLA